MPTSPPPPPPPPRGGSSTGLWTRFRSLPTWSQILLVIVLLTGLGLWLPDGDDGTDDARLATEDAAEAADAGARTEVVAAQAAADEEAAAAAEAAVEEAAAAEEAAREAAEERAAEERAAEERAAEEAAAERAAVEAAARTWTVHHVVDGDTVDVRHADGTEERVRIIGIDTPERGECGFDEATDAMAALVLHGTVELGAGARDDRDRYDRILRYVDVGGVDAGLSLIEDGLAIARYDSRDGYGRHDREAAYVAADAAADDTCTVPAPAPADDPAPAPAPPPSSGPGTGPAGAWRNCTEARDHGAAPVHRGDPGYGSHLDRDDDGVGCE